ncbi:hypothetical protein SNE40_015409 [Patella caerulea]|uniref:ubiquitinyl hydrolase 1 n=1 Tax=Patella caerulea TaxID=87958 RepID=A0AAN8JHX7_PATCE
MVWWILTSLYSFLVHSILDFVFFIFVDIVAKTVLKEAVSDEEKRRIWLFESAALVCLSVVIYLIDHTPVVLIPLTLFTFLYTQLYRRVDFRYWWNLVITRWEEAQQHKESMIQRKKHQLQQKSPPGAPVLRTIPHPAYYPHVHTPTAGGFPPNVTVSPGLDRNTFIVSHNQGLYPNLDQFKTKQNELPNYRSKFTESGGVGNSYLQDTSNPFKRNNYDQKPGEVHVKNNAFETELRRRPLRAENNRILSKIPDIYSSGSFIKSKVLNVLGLGSGPADSKPPGIRNNGQNLCFINSVVQCLARSPHLVQCLSVDSAKELECSVSESVLLTSFVELLHQCSVDPATNTITSLDPAAFRQSASALNPQVVSPPGQPQTQQDAAEFLMWILDTVHNILNKNRKALQSDKHQQQCGNERFSTSSLAMLKKIYGDLNKKRINDLKLACQREIELANGLENDSYAEPIQRLSDLEWLTHKHENDSSVDDLFKGQIVEAYHCLLDNHISVKMQAFNILPVPIIAPSVTSGLVLLDDCFTSFCHVEHLFGQDDLQCSVCVSDSGKKTPGMITRTQTLKNAASTPQNLVKGRPDSAFHSPSTSQMMSPIIGIRDIVNDSGYYDNVFKTSTPISELSNDKKKNPKDVQRRCLLRQLPECLTIQLLRFTYNARSGRSKKIRTPVSIPQKGLDLRSIIYDTVTDREDMTAPSGSHLYDLYGICLHLGGESTNNGHYVSYCLNDNKNWYRFDDEKVSQVNMAEDINSREVRENSYLLFYKQVERN